MRAAGGSARREYERRRAREVARQRANRKLWIPFTIATPFVIYLAVRLGLPWLVNGLWDSFKEAQEVQTEAPDPISGSTAHLLGLLAAVGATVNVIVAFWGRRQSTEAWATGAEGEARTGRLLARLPDTYSVVHDLPMPGSRANIDHLVVGPTGVFTIETKSYRGGVRISGGRVTVGGRRRDGIVEQARRQAEVISARIGETARPIVVVHGGVTLGWFTSPTVGGVRFCSPGRLVKVLRAGQQQLSPQAVADIAGRVGGTPPRLPTTAPSPAVEPPPPPPAPPPPPDGCGCGGHWVERHRRSDGAAFLGCSRFPACRSTRSLT